MPSLEALGGAIDRARQTLRRLEALGAIAIPLGDSAYPKTLGSISEPPPVLFVRGTAHLGDPGIAIVGTRNPTPYGAACSRRLAMAAAREGLTVVSGLASGCDSAAHVGAVEAGGVTVAVLAHGLDRVYPRENESLAERILDAGGALVSEYVPGKAPTRASFVERDRIQSGLAQGVIVVETGPVGGTMHTVSAAETQRRALAVVAPCGGEPTYEHGAQKLIARGAVVLAESGDFAAFLAALPSGDDDDGCAPVGQLRLFA
ncbi:MAG: DNA-processing protein DprA [Actinobacteria bacterium]|nr:DNA-processing protein DprA [Actinomycetota bacterium]